VSNTRPEAGEPPALSIILAVAGGSPLDEALTGLRLACRGIPVELIIVAAGTPPLAAAVEASFPDAIIECRPRGTLVPVLWAAGLSIARARRVAFTTGQVRVATTWARALLSALEAGAVGAGGPIELAPGADAATAAAYFVRFSAFSTPAWPKPARTRDIPGDNAAYDKEALLRHMDLLESGFWEVEFHRRFEEEGGVLQMEPGARAMLVGPVPFGPTLRQRYRHARVFGASRVAVHGERRFRLLRLAPLVPFVLIARIASRVLSVGEERRAFLKALPWIAPLSTAWAAGEAVGALRARGGNTARSLWGCSQ
jgi:hypothetical protein